MPTLTRVARIPCDSDEVSETVEELRKNVDRFDNLMEDCWRGRLRPEDQRELDELYGYLSILEETEWRETSMLTIDRLTELIDIPFPMVRYTIGMLP